MILTLATVTRGERYSHGRGSGPGTWSDRTRGEAGKTGAISSCKWSGKQRWGWRTRALSSWQRRAGSDPTLPSVQARLGLRPAEGVFSPSSTLCHARSLFGNLFSLSVLPQACGKDVRQFQPPPVPGDGGKSILGAPGRWRKVSLVCAHCSGKVQDSLCFLLFAWNLPKNPRQRCFAGCLSCFEGIFSLQRTPLKLLCDPVKKTNGRKPSLLPPMGGIQASM